MILESIIIDNIRSYDHAEVIFPQGICLFEGDIGAGKSSILMAIEFALFGLGSQKADGLLAKTADSGYVTLCFTVNKKRYEIRRTLVRKKSGSGQDSKNSWIKISDEKILLAASELKQRVIKILGFNEPEGATAESRIFRYAVFTPQETIKAVLSDSAKRLETIRRAFGIEDYSTAEANARALVQSIKGDEMLFMERSKDTIQIESQVNAAKEQIVQLKAAADAGRAKKRGIEEIKKNTDSELRQLQAQSREKAGLESQEAGLRRQIESKESHIRQLQKDIRDAERQLEEKGEELAALPPVTKPDTSKSASEIAEEIKKTSQIRDKLTRIRAQYDEVAQEIRRIRDKAGARHDADDEQIQKDVDALDCKEKAVQDRKRDATARMEDVKKNGTQSETRLKLLQSEAEALENLGNTCTTCGQPVSEEYYHSMIQEKNDQMSEIRTKMESISKSRAESELQLQDIAREELACQQESQDMQGIILAIKEYRKNSARHADMQLQMDGITDKHGDNLGAQIDGLAVLRDSVSSHQNLIQQMSHIKESMQKTREAIQRYKADTKSDSEDIKKQQAQVLQSRARLDEMRDTDDAIAQKEHESSRQQKEIAEAGNMIAVSDTQIDAEEQRLRECDTRLAESRRWGQMYKKYSQYKEWLEGFFIPSVSRIEKQVLLSILYNFNQTYVKWYLMLVEDPTKESGIDEDFTPTVRQDGYDQPVGFLSGGEKTSIALAYRLTLNSMMRKETQAMQSNLLILDEPTDGFSKSQLAKIRDVLDELQSQQIILVSHEKELETYVDNVFRVYKDGGTSRISSAKKNTRPATSSHVS